VALVFGRHIICFRVPLAVTAGILRIPYGVFASSVAVSSAVWAAILLELGVRFGNRLAEFGHLHRWLYVVVSAAFWLAVVAWPAIQHGPRRASADRESPELREASTP
jgi:membrane protein DedA with SNARE-associated domain